MSFEGTECEKAWLGAQWTDGRERAARLVRSVRSRPGGAEVVARLPRSSTRPNWWDHHFQECFASIWVLVVALSPRGHRLPASDDRARLLRGAARSGSHTEVRLGRAERTLRQSTTLCVLSPSSPSRRPATGQNFAERVLLTASVGCGRSRGLHSPTTGPGPNQIEPSSFPNDTFGPRRARPPGCRFAWTSASSCFQFRCSRLTISFPHAPLPLPFSAPRTNNRHWSTTSPRSCRRRTRHANAHDPPRPRTARKHIRRHTQPTRPLLRLRPARTPTRSRRDNLRLHHRAAHRRSRFPNFQRLRTGRRSRTARRTRMGVSRLRSGLPSRRSPGARALRSSPRVAPGE